jgi:NADPH2:quinone reductase
MSDAWRIVIRQNGGPEVLKREPLILGEPAPGMVRVRVTAVGVNFIDTYHRSGLYPVAFPSGLGSEVAGVIESLGTGVTDFNAGDRIAAILQTPAGYATHVDIDAVTLVPLPDFLSDEVAAATLLKGLTTWMLIEQCAKLTAGQSVLIYAAAGGVGSIAVPWAKAMGATVIAHAGTPAKAARAKSSGADHAFCDNFEGLPAKVRSVTGNHGADAILDGVGAASWTASLGSVAKRGIIVSFGNASGAVPSVSPLDLTKAGSIFLTRPRLFDYTDTPERLSLASARLFSLISDGIIGVEIGQRFSLADAAEAHRALESRQTVGSTILIP